MENIQYVMEWTEKHAGLGGWVGGVGAVLAIFVTWGLARAEYLRTRRQEARKVRAQLALIGDTIAMFTPILDGYLKSVRANEGAPINFYERQTNGSKFLATRDLANTPIMQWPSWVLYSCFKEYWFAFVEVLETSKQSPINRDDVEEKWRKYYYGRVTLEGELLLSNSEL